MLQWNFELLVGHSYSSFSHSALQCQKYATLYKLVNKGKGSLKLVQLLRTWWLSICSCCKHILKQWEQLKLHSTICKDKYCCYDIEMLSATYEDSSTSFTWCSWACCYRESQESTNCSSLKWGICWNWLIAFRTASDHWSVECWTLVPSQRGGRKASESQPGVQCDLPSSLHCGFQSAI